MSIAIDSFPYVQHLHFETLTRPPLCRYKALFEQTDNDKDGYISGVEIKNVFLQVLELKKTVQFEH